MLKFLIVPLVLASTLATADTIEEKRQKADAESQMKFSVSSMNKKCKTTIPDTGTIDWATWKGYVDDKTNVHAYNLCGYVAYGMGNLCSDDKIAQETIAKDIKKLVCKGDSTEDLKLELKDGTLTFHTRFGVTDTDKKTKAWLAKNLQ